MIRNTEGLKLPNFVQVLEDVPYEFHLIGSRMLACSHWLSDWDFCVQGDTGGYNRWGSPLELALHKAGFSRISIYSNRDKDINTIDVFERGWLPPSKMNIIVVRDVELCVSAFNLVKQVPRLLNNRHSTPMWNKVYKALQMGEPILTP